MQSTCKYGSIGKENHVPALARFNIIFQGETNDFDRAAELTSDRDQRARILSYLGMVVSNLGMLGIMPILAISSPIWAITQKH